MTSKSRREALGVWFVTPQRLTGARCERQGRGRPLPPGWQCVRAWPDRSKVAAEGHRCARCGSPLPGTATAWSPAPTARPRALPGGARLPVLAQQLPAALHAFAVEDVADGGDLVP